MNDEPRPGVPTRIVRSRVYLSGRAIFNEGRSSLDCQVRNVTSHGAKLTMRSTAELPVVFLLELTSGGERFAAAVRWRSDTEAGVSFDPSPNVQEQSRGLD
jgi:hypothetical protein